MKNIILIILIIMSSITFAQQSLDPSSYSDYNSFYNQLKTINNDWLNNSNDVDNIIDKEITTAEALNAESFNAKINALNKKADNIDPNKVVTSLRLTGGSGGGTTQLTVDLVMSDPSGATSGNSFVAPKTATYIVSMFVIGNLTYPEARIYKNGSFLKNEDGKSNSFLFYSWISGYEVSLTQGEYLTFHKESGGGGTVARGTVTITEKN